MNKEFDEELSDDQLDQVVGGGVPTWGGGPPDNSAQPNPYHGKHVDTGTDDAPTTESF